MDGRKYIPLKRTKQKKGDEQTAAVLKAQLPDSGTGWLIIEVEVGEEVAGAAGAGGGVGRSWVTNKDLRMDGCNRKEVGSEGRVVEEGGRWGEEGGMGTEGVQHDAEGVCSS